jgi:hypothetical protein
MPPAARKSHAKTLSTNQQNHFGRRYIYNCILSGRLSPTVYLPPRERPSMMPRSNHLTLVKPAPSADGADKSTRRTRELIERIVRGWRPDTACLASARHAGRWTVNHQQSAAPYQFIGWPQEPLASTSLIIASAIALDETEGWALLFGERWVTLGTRAGETEPFEPGDIIARAEAWLCRQP